MKKLMILAAMLLGTVALNAKTLVAYYSYTNNVRRIVNALSAQIDADVLEIQPAEKGLDYSANNYALGTQLLTAIRNNPNSASSYPAIDPVNVNMADYNMVIIAVPLWWSQMAAPFQTFLFLYGPQIAGKHIAVIVSSASTGISGVVADAKRLIPRGNFVEPNLWIRSSQTSNAASMISTWLNQIHYNDLAAVESVDKDTDVEVISGNGTISVNGDFSFWELYNLSGRKVLETAESRISTGALGRGVYIARVMAGNRCLTQKLSIY